MGFFQTDSKLHPKMRNRSNHKYVKAMGLITKLENFKKRCKIHGTKVFTRNDRFHS